MPKLFRRCGDNRAHDESYFELAKACLNKEDKRTLHHKECKIRKQS